jgi:hypothetical protein
MICITYQKKAEKGLTFASFFYVAPGDTNPSFTPQWQEKGLYFFFLPKYCSEMNPIKPEWHQLKTHELAGQMFEDEYDLALVVMDGVEAQGHRGGYSTVRFKFNSA